MVTDKKKKEKEFVPIGDIIGQTLKNLENRVVPQLEQEELFEMTDLYNARGLRFKNKTAVVIADEFEEVTYALSENFPLVMRNYGGTTRSEDSQGHPGCMLYVQNIEDAKRIKGLAPQGIIPRSQEYPIHVTYRYRNWQDLIWLAQRFMRERLQKKRTS